MGGLPWKIVGLLGLFNAGMREIYEMRYLWQVPHRVDGGKLAHLLPEFRPTPIDRAFKDVLASQNRA
jgi:hypothetical protein